MLESSQKMDLKHPNSNHNLDWWRGAVIYQIYPRSFKDTTGNGVGDLNGIIENFEYIADLGVDAIWISPFFKSPMKDFGYDISDYRDIDPLFGTLDDFDRLIKKAHQYNIKVIIDQVLSHTSDQHQWFLKSQKCRTNDQSDWYVWADSKEDGTPPNNWLSIFGGSAWQWEPRRKQYYLHNFLASQPDLNFHNKDVQKATLDNIEFWLKRGVDGFRLDAINFCFHDQDLKDNPAKLPEDREGRGFSEDNPYAFQYHYYNNTQPENIPFIESIRKLLNRYPGCVALGEISSEDSLATMAEYTQNDSRLHMGYSFELLTEDCSAQYIRQTVQKLESEMKQGWPCWAISNHDVERVASRWHCETKMTNIKQCDDTETSNAKSKLLSALLFSLRGSVCTYQGEELGLKEADVPFEKIKDPYGLAFWPDFKGRDGCRTPMPWNENQLNANFSNAIPWLPLPQDHIKQSAKQQGENKHSVLNSFKQYLSWRKLMPALVCGEIQFILTPDPVIAFYRVKEKQKIILLFNLSNQQQTIELNLIKVNENELIILREHGIRCGKLSNKQIILPSFGCFIAKVNKAS